MLQILMIFLLATSVSLFGTSGMNHLAGSVSPSTSNEQGDDDADDTGEVDEDIIITDDEDSDDDEGVNN